MADRYAIKTLRVAWAEKRWLIRESDGHSWSMMPQGDGWVILPDLRGQLPPAPDGDPVEMRAARLAAIELAGQGNYARYVSTWSSEEISGYCQHGSASVTPNSPERWAGWLAAEMVRAELDGPGDGERGGGG